MIDVWEVFCCSCGKLVAAKLPSAIKISEIIPEIMYARRFVMLVMVSKVAWICK